MRTYSEIIFDRVSPELLEILVARLAEAGYDGFLEEGDTLKAYQNEESLDTSALDALSKEYNCRYRVNRVAEENWNATWESSFSPVVVEDFVAVRADFHDFVKNVEYEIVITPKMSFGTGHHATTWLMLKAMRDTYLQGPHLQGPHLQGPYLQGPYLQGADLGGREVLDFGTGTGILAILAEKMGAGRVLAIDNDTWSIDNATENLARNSCEKIELRLGESIPLGSQFDLVLANINKHILLGHSRYISEAVKTGGMLIMSGILSEDLDDMEAAFGLYLGKPVKVEERNNWLMIAFSKSDASQD
jgi:ribosomal protein L11 methyltransferase